ncbi:MAG: hypothetical protein WD097_06285 [Balneolales bacterium]
MSLTSGLINKAAAQWSDDFRIHGYLQGMPIRISAEIPEPDDDIDPGSLPSGDQTWWEYRLQNRINMRWYASSAFTFTWEMRTRLFAGDLVKDIPGYARAMDVDDGFFDMSWLVVEQDNWLLHYIPDRFYGEWTHADWSVQVGRQRVNWGINTITNPNDLFNLYSFYDFDYPERPGSDAVRIQRFTGFASRMEIAVSPDRNLENSVAAALYAFNKDGYDVQLIGGYYRDRLATGGGWAGNIKGAGFKGEAMFFIDLNANGGTAANGFRSADTGREYNVIISVSSDYIFGNGLFLLGELLYNKAGGRDDIILFAETRAPDNPSFSRFQCTTQGSIAFTPILDGSLAAVWYPDESAVFISPSLSWSVMTDLDFRILGQFFAGRDDSVFSNAGNVAAASLRWNF